MKRLRVEFGGKALDAVRIDTDAPGAEGLSRCEIFQVALGHGGSGSLDFDDDFALRMVASSSANRKSRIPNARRCAPLFRAIALVQWGPGRFVSCMREIRHEGASRLGICSAGVVALDARV